MPNARPRWPRRYSLFLNAGQRRLVSAPVNHGPRGPQPVEQPTVTNDDGTKTLRERRHGGISLPLPPFMDPIAIKSKSKHTEPKALEPEGGKTEFQQQLEQNPYAQALATPVRQCSLTYARLPSHFLLPLVSTIDPSADREAGRIKAHLQPDFNIQAPRYLRSPARSYVLSRLHVIQALRTKKWWPRAVSERMKKWFELKTTRQQHNLKVQQDWQWDSETPVEVLAKLREDVIVAFKSARRCKRIFVLRDHNDWLATARKDDVACVLRLMRHAEDIELEDAGDTAAAFQRNFGAGINLGVCLYDLTWLLDEAALTSAIVGDEELKHATWLFVSKGSPTLKLQSSLLRLSSYMCEPNAT